jgi:hypothetical protein
MGKTNYLKFFSLLAFIAFAAISCWATAESLHLLLSSWPIAFCWVVSVGFFIIASLGTKMIVDSLNQNVYIEKRGMMLGGGILLVILFWLICVMPTNTHTFFFRNVIKDKVTLDITTTQKYLSDIKNNQKNLGTIQCSNLCHEICEYTSREEIAVCNLASVALPKYIEYNKNLEPLLILLEKLKPINPSVYEKIKEDLDKELKYCPIDKYEYWADAPFRTIPKTKFNNLNDESDFINKIYS